MIETPQYDKLIEGLVQLCEKIAEKWATLLQAQTDDSIALGEARAEVETLKNAIAEIDNAASEKLAPSIEKLKETFGLALAVEPPTGE